MSSFIQGYTFNNWKHHNSKHKGSNWYNNLWLYERTHI